MEFYMQDKIEEIFEAVFDFSQTTDQSALHSTLGRCYQRSFLCLAFWTFSKILCDRYNATSYLPSGLIVWPIILLLITLTIVVVVYGPGEFSEKSSLALLLMCILDPFTIDYQSVELSLSSWTPLPLLLPLSILIVLQVIGQFEENRPRLCVLTAVVASNFTICFVYALITGNSSSMFTVWTIFFATFSVADFQIKVAQYREYENKDGFVVYEQYRTVVLLLTINYVLLRINAIPKYQRTLKNTTGHMYF